jgi:hypothetical protein
MVSNTDLESVEGGKRPQDLILGNSCGDDNVETAGAGEEPSEQDEPCRIGPLLELQLLARPPDPASLDGHPAGHGALPRRPRTGNPNPVTTMHQIRERNEEQEQEDPPRCRPSTTTHQSWRSRRRLMRSRTCASRRRWTAPATWRGRWHSRLGRSVRLAHLRCRWPTTAARPLGCWLGP